MHRSLKGSASPAFLALSCVGFIASAPGAFAADDIAADVATAEADTDSTTTQRDRDILVTGQETRSEQESPKATRPVRDTPQTVTILTNKVIEEQNLLTLREVLSTVPGITFGAAEGGVAPSDTITLRGYSATSDITVDGVRDSAPYTRSDPFNLEQVEVVNGANSVYNGSGSLGGSINIVTKSPKPNTEVAVQGGIGTDEYYRGAIDANIRAGEMVAVRLNGMYHKNNIPGRDVDKVERWGFAPSVTLGIEGPTRLTLKYLHQEDDNIPQYGVPYYKNAFFNGALPGIDRSDYFGYRNVDTQQVTVDQATAVFSHDFSENLSIRNLTRWQEVSQLTIVGPPQGTFCLPNGAGSITATGTACPATTPLGYYLIGGPRGNFRDTTSTLMYDQLDLAAKFNTGAIEHSLVAGASFGWEEFELSTGNVYRNANSTLAYSPFPLVNWANPNDVIAGPAAAGRVYGSNVYTGPINPTETGRQRGEVTNYAVYLFDAMKFGKFEINGGIRYEKNSGKYRTDAVAVAATLTTPQGPLVTGPTFTNEADLFSYRVGLVFKPVEAITLYAAYGNSQTPSQTAVNGACVATSCNVDPETGKNYEIGAKAELAGLLLSVAAFQNERDKYKVPSNDPTIPDQVLDGHSRVRGIAVSATGQITPEFSITANYTYLEPKLLQSVSNSCLATPSTACANSAAIRDPAAGAELQNTPKHSGSLFATYQFPFGLKVGYSVTYQGDFALNLPALTAAGASTLTKVYRSDDYFVHNALIGYDVGTNFTVQLNVKNFTDELYYTRIRNNGWATPGDARAAVLTIGYRF